MYDYIVYVLTDTQGHITAINSSAFLADTTGWVQIDQGGGDKYHHAQGNYFDKPITDNRGIYRYELVDGQPVERTQEEMDADYAAMPVPAVPKTNAELEAENVLLKAQVQAIAERSEFVEDCIAEIATEVYNE